ncbi:hypothetical protein L1987_20701 [Smallanthus sonchifolius]|uniref:Uncharacterized protein n=1 Tax=Smallanthus sonchifolius TaxID=185202 RepID=A0ACB9IVA3_9ASTR|nr:hypothetical protein L1987_20701 [Smallanthus sonchifolius]
MQFSAATFDLQREWLSAAMLLISSKTQLSIFADDLPISSNFGLQQIRLSAANFFSRRTNNQSLEHKLYHLANHLQTLTTSNPTPIHIVPEVLMEPSCLVSLMETAADVP